MAQVLKTSFKTWVFDLDNTLHNATPHIFPHISRAMTQYLRTHLGLDETGANELRVRYWHHYGATLLGLIRYHNVDARHFLWHTHQFPDLPRMILAEGGLRATLRRLPGRKVIFSNAPVHYSKAVLGVLNIADLFQDIFTIERTRFRPKPDAAGFYRLFQQHRLNPARCIMVEDSLENLKTAKKLGMKTVWVSAGATRPRYVDVSVNSVLRLPKLLHKL